MRIHVVGASGSGTTTLGRALAEHSGSVHLDIDDYYWEPSDPPFQDPRPPALRLQMLVAAADRAGAWVASGSMVGWGDPLMNRLDGVIFLRVPTDVRLSRLRRREREHFGEAALAPGGAMYENHGEFIEWAAGYAHGDMSGRSLARHLEWLARLVCPVLTLEGDRSQESQLAEAVRFSAGLRAAPDGALARR